MSHSSHSVSNDEESNSQLEELRERVSISNAELIELVADEDRFVMKLKELNKEGIKSVEQEAFKEALVYLQEAEKILEYAASCGKTIDRALIVVTLQNQACVYQKLWELEKSFNYMEAIIFNMNTFLQTSLPIVIDAQALPANSAAYLNLSTLIHKRLQLAKCYLRFSALCSQMQKHQIALGSAMNSLSIMKQVCQDCYNYERFNKKDYIEIESGSKTMMKELAVIRENVELDKYEKYLLLAKKTVKKLKMKSFKSEKIYNKNYEKIMKFAIGELMQVPAGSLEQLDLEPNVQQQISYINKLYKAIYISLAYFTIATELRLIAQALYPQQEKMKSEQFRKSELFHLNSVIIAAKYLPFQTRYLSHILKSYSSHYNIQLGVVFEESQETTHQTEGDHPNIILTPNKHSKSSHDLKLKYSKHDITKLTLGGRDRYRDKIKIPMLHAKKKTKKSHRENNPKIDLTDINFSKSKKKLKLLGSETFRIKEHQFFEKRKKHIETQREHPRDYQNYFQTNYGNFVSHKQKKLKSIQVNSKSKSKTKKEDVKKQKSIEKITRKINRLKEQYFKQPQEKKKPKKNITQHSLSKNKLQSPFSKCSPKNIRGKKLGK